MNTKADDYAFVYDNIHRSFKVNKARVGVIFAQAIGWKVGPAKMHGREMFVEFYGKKDGGEEELIPDYASDLEALRETLTIGRLVAGPEYSFFDERDRIPTGWAVYASWSDVALDYIDRAGSIRALAISQDLNIAIILGFMVRRKLPFDLEEMK
jgi:hypothetical protein